MLEGWGWSQNEGNDQLYNLTEPELWILHLMSHEAQLFYNTHPILVMSYKTSVKKKTTKQKKIGLC
jgi:hypothetical protein